MGLRKIYAGLLSIFFIAFLSNFSNMNVIIYDFWYLKVIIFLNLQFNYTSCINCNTTLNFRSKMGDTSFLNDSFYYNIGE